MKPYIFVCVLLLCRFTHCAQAAVVQTDDIRMRVELRANGLVITELNDSKARSWVQAPSEVLLITNAWKNGTTVPLNWRFNGEQRSEGTSFSFKTDAGLDIASHWTAQSGAGPVQHSIRMKNVSDTTLTLPLQPSLTIDFLVSAGAEHWWVEKGAAIPTSTGVHRARVTAGYDSTVRTVPYTPDDEALRDAIPWTTIHDAATSSGIYAGIEFSGRTTMHLKAVEATGNTVKMRLTLGLDPGLPHETPYTTVIPPGGVFETPKVFIGAYSGDVDDGSNRLRRWVETNLRPAVPIKNYPPLVNNSWGSGMAVDEKLARTMIDESAQLGLEIFHVDAGWFRGVGYWHELPEKFPSGLAAIADYAHSKGLLFGLWTGWTQGGIMSPADAKHKTLNVFDSVQKSWFQGDLPADWHPSEFTGTDVCLASTDAQEWCLDELRRMVKDFKLDLLEHDQRIVVDVCTRDNHRHTQAPGDVSYHAAKGYYSVYDTLRSENPNLLFEDCVNGGRMIDYGVVRRVHYISITDTYTPLANRRAFHDASYALPPSMCEAYIANMQVNTVAEFRHMLRSGMQGWCTIMCDTSQWTPQQHDAARQEFATYKKHLRPLIAAADLYHVSERPDGVRWDGMQYYDKGRGEGVLYAFRGSTDDESNVFKLKGLEPHAGYSIRFQDTGTSSSVGGRELLEQGLKVTLPEANTSELVFITRN